MPRRSHQFRASLRVVVKAFVYPFRLQAIDGIAQEMLLSQQPSQDPQDATFSDSRFQLDYLTQPNGLSDMLITWGQPNVLERAQDTDEVRADSARCIAVLHSRAL